MDITLSRRNSFRTSHCHHLHNQYLNHSPNNNSAWHPRRFIRCTTSTRHLRHSTASTLTHIHIRWLSMSYVPTTRRANSRHLHLPLLIIHCKCIRQPHISTRIKIYHHTRAADAVIKFICERKICFDIFPHTKSLSSYKKCISHKQKVKEKVMKGYKYKLGRHKQERRWASCLGLKLDFFWEDKTKKWRSWVKHDPNGHLLVGSQQNHLCLYNNCYIT